MGELFMITRKSPIVCYTGYYVPGGNTIKIQYANFVYRKITTRTANGPNLRLYKTIWRFRPKSTIDTSTRTDKFTKFKT